eukprot:g33148.t1
MSHHCTQKRWHVCTFKNRPSVSASETSTSPSGFAATPCPRSLRATPARCGASGSEEQAPRSAAPAQTAPLPSRRATATGRRIPQAALTAPGAPSQESSKSASLALPKSKQAFAVDTVQIRGGFLNPKLNTVYLMDAALQVGARATYWDDQRRFFMYYQASLKRWAISLYDAKTGQDMLENARRGGLCGFAFEVDKSTNQWQEFHEGRWVTVHIDIQKLCTGKRAPAVGVQAVSRIPTQMTHELPPETPRSTAPEVLHNQPQSQPKAASSAPIEIKREPSPEAKDPTPKTSSEERTTAPRTSGVNEAEAAAVSPSRLLWPEGEEEARSASPEEWFPQKLIRHLPNLLDLM